MIRNSQGQPIEPSLDPPDYDEEEEFDEELEPVEDEDAYCIYCSGSGEGRYDGSTCSVCKGSGLANKHY